MTQIYKSARRGIYFGLKNMLHKLNLDLTLYPNDGDLRRHRLLKRNNIDTVLDVGANKGQYALDLFKKGFKGNIVSFEPVSAAYKVLNRRAERKDSWKAYKLALGSENMETEINVASDDQCSSLLTMKGDHIEGSSDIFFIGKQKLTVRTLDSIWESHIASVNPQNVYLKIDTQGFEKDVLKGAERSLSKITGIQLEMSLVEQYEGEWLYESIVNYLAEKGFSLYSIEPGYYNRETGQLLQMDGIFYRSADTR